MGPSVAVAGGMCHLLYLQMTECLPTACLCAYMCIILCWNISRFLIKVFFTFIPIEEVIYKQLLFRLLFIMYLVSECKHLIYTYITQTSCTVDYWGLHHFLFPYKNFNYFSDPLPVLYWVLVSLQLLKDSAGCTFSVVFFFFCSFSLALHPAAYSSPINHPPFIKASKPHSVFYPFAGFPLI